MKFACDFLVVAGNLRDFLFDLGLGSGQADVNVGDLVDAGLRFFVLQFNGTLGAQRVLVVDADLFQFAGERLKTALSNAKLVKGLLQLALDFVIVGLQFSQLQRLLLDDLLQVNVRLVGNVQGHFQLGDVNLELLLDTQHFGLEAGFGLNDASVKLFNFDGSLLAAEKRKNVGNS